MRSCGLPGAGWPGCAGGTKQNLNMNRVDVDDNLILDLFEKYTNSDQITGYIRHSEDFSIVINEIADDDDVLWGTQGVYFLEWNNYPVYIGESGKCIYTRIFGQQSPPCDGHIDKNWIFNTISFIEFPNISKSELREIEYIYINLFDPYYNRAFRNKAYVDLLPNEYKIRISNSRLQFLNMIDVFYNNLYNKLADSKFFNPGCKL